MKNLTRRNSLLLLSGLVAPTVPGMSASASTSTLPLSTTFQGKWKFDQIIKKAVADKWHSKSMHERMILVAKQMHGTSYANFTLEIDDHVEAPSVNFNGLDCWTFFETALGLSRMISRNKESYSPEDLLREIQWTRYRGGKCTGNYLERIHYLAEWFFENDARGNVKNITEELGGAQKISNRKITEMTALWKHYRYLRENPQLRAPMKSWEDKVAKLPVSFIPKYNVAAVEPKLRDGDIIGIVTKYDGGFCSHVGIIHRTNDKVARFMHASRNYRKVVIDKSISGYLNSFNKHAGMMVARPLETSNTVTSEDAYRNNLKKLVG